MNKAMFMARLRELLADITEAEREEALNYYEDYFDDAGEENEESVIEALGSPERVAATIKEGLNDNTGSDGEFSENGYTSGNDRNREEVAARTLSSEERGFGKKKGKAPPDIDEEQLGDGERTGGTSKRRLHGNRLLILA